MSLKNIMLLTLSVLFISSTSAFSATVIEETSEQSLLNQGYSPEGIRIVKLQKQRCEGKEDNSKKKNIFSKFFSTLRQYSDVTVNSDKFGEQTVK